MEPAIRVENIGKLYRVAQNRDKVQYHTLRDTLVDYVKAPFRRLKQAGMSGDLQDFWALKDVSFEVQPGEVVGIIGRNGAGKSTLLKILSRITKPTTGRIEINGRVGSLLEVGTGFHPELTGRENIYLNGSILGMSRAEIKAKFDEIVAFAEIDQFLDTPVKRYSSGMYVRLAFAVAAHLQPEILIVDEVLAVGDAEFQKKCLGKMQDVATQGKTVLFVSHNMAVIRQLTSRCIYLRAGQVAGVDHTAKAIDLYMADSESWVGSGSRSLDFFRRGSVCASTVRFAAIRFLTSAGQLAKDLRSGDAFRLEVEIVSEESHARACLTFWLTGPNGDKVALFFSGDTGHWFPIRPGSQTVVCEVSCLPLSPGKYLATIGINRATNTMAFDVLVDYPSLSVIMPEVESGERPWPERPWGAVHWPEVRWGCLPNCGGVS